MRGLVLISFGVLYLIKPDIFKNGIYKYSVAARSKTPEEYRKYMQRLAIILLIIGSLLLAYDNRHLLIPESILFYERLPDFASNV